MTFRRFLFRNLIYHWRGNSAVFLGVVVGTAVLTGALLVGDSLRGSLEEIAVQRLGWVDQALESPHFIREETADRVTAPDASRRCPALMLQGAANPVTGSANQGNVTETGPRVPRVTILGVDDRFWPDEPTPVNPTFWRASDDTPPESSGVVLSAALARALDVKAGQTVALHLQKSSQVPAETLLGRRSAGDVLEDLQLPVRAVLADDQLGSRFSLHPSPSASLNAFVPLRVLQATVFPRQQAHDRQQHRVNTILVQGGNPEALQKSLADAMQLGDWGLQLLPRQPQGYLSLQSQQMFLDPVVSKAAVVAAEKANLRSAPTLVYLANRISDQRKHEFIPYSVVAALDPSSAAPLGPFLPTGVTHLDDDQIVLADWKQSPLHPRPGDHIIVTYFSPEVENQYVEREATFRLAGTAPMRAAAADPGLTPDFPGITDKLNIAEWNPPFPYNNKLIKPRDEDYWHQYRTTPKAYITLAAGQKLWGSRFGNLTSIRMAPTTGTDLSGAVVNFRREFHEALAPERGGLLFKAVRAEALKASNGSTDFNMLFLGFSFFLILAALLLVGLLFRLNLERRGNEIGMLLATGFRRRTVRWVLLGEGAVLAALGGLVGVVAAAGYASLLLAYLGSRWPGGLNSSLLHFHATAQSYAVGYVAALLVSLLTILWAVRVLGRVAPSALLAGQAVSDSAVQPGRLRWSRWVCGGSVVLAILCLAAGFFTHDTEMRASSFFGSGMLLLIAGLAGVWMWLRGSRQSAVHGQGLLAVVRLGLRNAARQPTRSLLTAGLLASATFLVVAVESFHRDPGADFLNRDGGSGGFALFGQSDLPIYPDLNTSRGQEELRLSDEAKQELKGTEIYALRVHAGDDASCLNLYKPRQPQLYGVPHSLAARGGFNFQGGGNPWPRLEQTDDDGAIPVFGDATTIEWQLQDQLHDGVLTVTDGAGNPQRLRIVGQMQNSIFQNGLLMSEANFLKLYPRSEGYNFFLMNVPASTSTDQVRHVLDLSLAHHGFVARPTIGRVESYLAVENTYLATFQALGGLGLLLGAIGLAVVLLRSVWERRAELALLRALGYRHRTLGWLVLTENAALLVLGLLVGLISAILAVAPPLFTGEGTVPALRLAALLALVFGVGLAAGTLAMATALRAPLLSALRRE